MKTSEETEGVADDFSLGRLHEARRIGWEILREMATRVRPGHSTRDLKALLEDAMTARGLGKPWHPPQLRIGPSTRCPFNEAPLDKLPLRENDIFFLDIGPLIDGYEADVGQTFVCGDDKEMRRCADDARELHRLGQAHWHETRCTGRALYDYTRALAEARDWQLALKGANGHRLGDFPHHRFHRGNLISCDFTPRSDRWVYEVQLLSRDGRFGAFYEDLLSDTVA